MSKKISGKLIATLFVFFCFVSASIAQQKESKTWTLNECIQYALENNIQVQQTELNQQIAEQDVVSSKYALLPSVNGFATNIYNFGQTIDPFTNQFATERVRSNSLGVNAQLTLFDGFRNFNTVKRNQASLKASEYDLEKMKNDISLNIANQFLQILFNKELLRNAENQLKVTEIQVDRVSKQVKAGALPEGSLRDIEAQLASEELQKVNAENQLKLSSLNLAQLLRLENADGFEIVSPNLDDFQGSSELSTPGALYQTALDVMPEVKSAEYNYYSADKSKAMAKGAYYPTLTMTGSVGSGYSGANQVRTGGEFVGFSENGNVTAGGEAIFSPVVIPTFEDKAFTDQLDDNFNRSFGFRLNIPIFNGLSSRTNVQKAKLSLQSAALTLEDTKLQLRQNIESAHTDAVAALKRYRAAVKSVEALELSFQYTQERFNVGMINSFDFNNEKNRLNNARSELLQAKYDYIFRTKVLDFYQGKAISFQNN
ncbi:MAG: TolC family protein [Vicingaceae bacterium]